jgi:hypothetical protein
MFMKECGCKKQRLIFNQSEKEKAFQKILLIDVCPLWANREAADNKK